MTVPATSYVSSPFCSGHAHETREVARRGPALLTHSDSALGSDQRSVHVIDGLLDATLESAVQRGDGEEACVALGEPAEVGRILEARRIASGEPTTSAPSFATSGRNGPRCRGPPRRRREC